MAITKCVSQPVFVSRLIERIRCLGSRHREHVILRLTTVCSGIAQCAVAGCFVARRTFGTFAVMKTVRVCLALERCKEIRLSVELSRVLSTYFDKMSVDNLQLQ